MVIGLVPVFEEANNIGYCVESMLAAGCDRVVCLDGAYRYVDGSSFMGGGVRSDDGTVEVAEAAGAEVIVPDRQPRFGEKRQMLLEQCGAGDGDHVLIMDADERAVGRLDDLPDGHACVVFRNLKPNDLPGLRMVWPHGDAGDVLPHLRVLRWSRGLRFVGFGEFEENGHPVRAYTDKLDGTLEQACALPLIEGFEIHHVAPASAERVAAKRKAYAR